MTLTDRHAAELGITTWEEEREPCHSTQSGTLLLDTYAIETATCCGLEFKAHDETVTDHVVESVMLWNAQLHDMVDNIERQARESMLEDEPR
jgi:hypothetical protein